MISQATGETVDEMVDPHSVRAVEIYPDHGMGAPIEYGGSDAYGGVILIWTK